MQDKQKVTLYIPPELHRQLKIRAAVDSEPMSVLAEKALIFYLSHPEIVEQLQIAHGQAHRVYNCPECATSVVVREGEMVAVDTGIGVVEVSVQPSVAEVDAASHQGEEELVPC